MKRRVALLRSLQRPSDAISALIQLLDAIPTDAEAWGELADLYQSQGLGSQAIFGLEEALLIAPNSWNVWPNPFLSPSNPPSNYVTDFWQIHARLGELLFVCSSSSEGDSARLAGKSVQHFCRSIELCDDYLRGLYGLILVSLAQGRESFSYAWFTDLNSLLLLHRPPLTCLITSMPLKAPRTQPLPLRRPSRNSGNSHFGVLGILFSPGRLTISVGHRVEVSSSQPRSCSIASRRPKNSRSIIALLFFGYPNQTYQHVPCDKDVKDLSL